MVATETESALEDVASAPLDFMDVIVLWLSALIARVPIATASMDLALVRQAGPEKTARLLSARTIALDTEFAMMELASATLVGLELTAPQESVLVRPAEILAAETDVATQSVFSACALMAGPRVTAPRSLAPMIVLEMVSATTVFALALLDSPVLTALRALV